ncbi:LOW QUALITY PROTEIN: Str_synth domain-containing protein, partial [Cephalotus follicularis]
HCRKIHVFMAPENQQSPSVRSTLKPCVSACSSFLLVCLIVVTLIFFFSPISSPNLLELPPPSSSSFWPTNNHLQRVVKLGEGLLKHPEDISVDSEGILYTATRDGWIKRLHKNGSVEDWKMLNGDTLLGITTTKEGGLIVCDTDKGLLKVTEDGVTVLASHVNGSKIRFADDVIEGSDGSLYFSVASTKFGLHNWYLDLLEAKPYGKLLKYDPLLNETSILLEDLAFANGVALSRDEDYLVVCETWKFRCLKHWLKGETKGKTEIFIDNLPGGPDNINLAPDGSFWIALLQLASPGWEFIHTSKASKYLVARSQKLIMLVNGVFKKATVINVDSDGKVLKKFDDHTGKVMSLVTSALEFEDHLYLGSLNTNFIGKLPLTVG